MRPRLGRPTGHRSLAGLQGYSRSPASSRCSTDVGRQPCGTSPCERRRGDLDFEVFTLGIQFQVASWTPAGGAGFAGGGGDKTGKGNGRTHDALLLDSRCHPGRQSTESHDLHYRSRAASSRSVQDFSLTHHACSTETEGASFGVIYGHHRTPLEGSQSADPWLIDRKTRNSLARREKKHFPWI